MNYWEVTDSVDLPQQVRDLQSAIGVQDSGVIDDDTWAMLRDLPAQLAALNGQAQALAAQVSDLSGRATQAIGILNGG